jgi:hypothetical protein
MFHHFRKQFSTDMTRQISLGVLFIILTTTTVMLGADSITGDWQGTIDTGSQKLRLVLHVTGDQKMGWKATVDSLDQKAMGLTVDTITLADSTLNFEMNRLQANFTGKWNPKQNSIVGTWSQQSSSLPLTFSKMQNQHVSQSAAKR